MTDLPITGATHDGRGAPGRDVADAPPADDPSGRVTPGARRPDHRGARPTTTGRARLRRDIGLTPVLMTGAGGVLLVYEAVLVIRHFGA